MVLTGLGLKLGEFKLLLTNFLFELGICIRLCFGSGLSLGSLGFGSCLGFCLLLGLLRLGVCLCGGFSPLLLLLLLPLFLFSGFAFSLDFRLRFRFASFFLLLPGKLLFTSTLFR